MIRIRIREACRKRNIPIAKLERDCKFNDGIVGAWHNLKQYPSLKSLIKVCQYLQCTLDEVIVLDIKHINRF